MEGSTTGECMGGVTQSPGKLTVVQIKGMRVDLDRILSIVVGSDYMKAGEQVIVKLKEARHWLGECLKGLGHDLPAEYQDRS